MKKIIFILVLTGILKSTFCIGQDGIVVTIANQGCNGLCVDSAGNIYFLNSNNFVEKVDAVTGIIDTIGGNGTLGFSGDGGPATNASFSLFSAMNGICLDNSGNVYIGDFHNDRIRKIDATTGLISTFAGGGSSVGDGGPATNAILTPSGMFTDATGNLYFADNWNMEIRKINISTGIITSIAGNGTTTNSGDGGPATAAGIPGPQSVSMDARGNIYISSGIASGGFIRKIDATTGLISSIAGDGTSGDSGDGGPATNSEITLDVISGVDISGNVYLAHLGGDMRKIDPTTGIINLLGSTSGSTADSIPVTSAKIQTSAMFVDLSGNIYYSDGRSIRKIILEPTTMTFSADSFSVTFNELCNGPQSIITPRHFSPGMSVKTYFGDGTTDSTVLSSISGIAVINHSYASSGTYTIKHLLFNGSAKLDSISFTITYNYCRTIQTFYYLDVNSNCIYDTTVDFPIYLPIATEVDSNGIVIDTLSSTSGFTFSAYGNPGDTYTFKVVNHAPGDIPTCPSTGTLSNVLPSDTSNIPTDFFAFNCSSLSGFDLQEFVSFRAGRHAAGGDIIVDNTYCTPTTATLVATLSKYNFGSANFIPTSVSGNAITWDLGILSSVIFYPLHIHFTMNVVTGPLYVPGDTLSSSYTVSPVTGDVNPLNNYDIRIDTVTSSYDPNYMDVIPFGYISAGTTLTYSIAFENTGNDTAHNIYILDTLSNNLDISSFKVLTASSEMITTKQKDVLHNILRFDFPGINLPDSTHHDLCNGLLMYSINAKGGLPQGTLIPNEAGIYFDDNPVVMTNTDTDIIGHPTGINAINTTDNIQIFPNPVANELTIQTQNSAFNSFTITNSIGQALIQKPIINNVTKVNVQSLPGGLYYISFRGNNGMEVKKFVKI